uniref:Uncharacterized protein n=1 Tax=Fagus sylvatica TaxID=28930 RepID=A0A2N9IE88_FAGSY
MVKLLLLKGANKDVRNRGGKTAYDVAAEFGHNRLFDALKLGDSLCVAARKASFKGKVDAVRALVEKGIDIDGKDEDGYTALHCAAESGQAEVMELLVKKGADVEARTNKGVTALQIAESLHYIGITRILIQGGATKDNMVLVPTPKSLPFVNKMLATQEAEIGGLKKKPSRDRGLRRSSFGQSVPLAVL